MVTPLAAYFLVALFAEGKNARVRCHLPALAAHLTCSFGRMNLNWRGTVEMFTAATTPTWAGPTHHDLPVTLGTMAKYDWTTPTHSTTNPLHVCARPTANPDVR